jgi:A/G-specific adenine glycosylase
VRGWYARHGRDLPWRRTRDPYAILVSEFMLQQTQVARVIPKYREFLARFPSIARLAAAPLRDVLHAWSGLGYNSRARRLWECARAIVREHRGRVPRDIASLRGLPGIGRYTAGAVASFAFGAAEASVDVNIRRVLSRALLAVDDAGEARAWKLAEAALPRDAAAWNHALMDIGALFCRATPLCDDCPAQRACAWAALSDAQRQRRARTALRPRQTAYRGSRRQHRVATIRALTLRSSLSLLRLGPQVKADFGKTDIAWLAQLLDDLERDGLVVFDRDKSRVRLP